MYTPSSKDRTDLPARSYVFSLHAESILKETDAGIQVMLLTPHDGRTAQWFPKKWISFMDHDGRLFLNCPDWLFYKKQLSDVIPCPVCFNGSRFFFPDDKELEKWTAKSN